MCNKADNEELSALLEKFHSVLNTAWPKPGVPAMANASVFIGTTLFKGLEDGLNIIEDAIEASEACDFKKEAMSFWNVFRNLFTAIGKQDRYKQSEQVDFAFNLLYLASGVFYYRVVELSSKQPGIDRRTIEVEPFEDLLRLCRWPGKTENVKSVYSSLIHEMMACAQDLQRVGS
jgi:hypothetical protein